MSAEIVNPNETARAEAFELWMQASQPMVIKWTACMPPASCACSSKKSKMRDHEYRGSGGVEFDKTAIPDGVVKTLIDRAYEYVYNRIPRKTKESLI